MLRDMAGSKTHTAESWARILLNNTARLTDIKEQEKFWRFLSNPNDDEDIPDPVCTPMVHSKIEEPKQYTTSFNTNPQEEKSNEEEVKIDNEYFRNGHALYIRSIPVNTDSSVSSLLPRRLSCVDVDLDEKTNSETSSVPLEQSEQKQDTTSNKC